MHCTICIIHCTIYMHKHYTLHCSYIIHCTMYITHTLYIVQYTCTSIIHCIVHTLYIVQCTLHIHYTLYNIHAQALYTSLFIHYTLYNVHTLYPKIQHMFVSKQSPEWVSPFLYPPSLRLLTSKSILALLKQYKSRQSSSRTLIVIGVSEPE